MPRVLVRPRMPRRILPRSTFGLPRPFGTPGSGSGGCSSIAAYVVFATGTGFSFFPFGLANGFFLPFLTNFLVFPLPVSLEKPSPADSDSPADSVLVAGSVAPTCFVGDGGKGFIDPSLSLSTPLQIAVSAPGVCTVSDGPEVNEVSPSAALAIPAVEFPASPATDSASAGVV